MRLRIELQTNKGEISVDYRYACISYIKHLLDKHYEEKYLEMYERSVMKTMTFNLFIPEAKIVVNKIKFNGNKLYLNISSCDDQLVFMLYNSVLAEKNMEYPFPDSLSLKTMNVSIIEQKRIESDSVKIKMIAPLLVRKHSSDSNIDEYLTPNDGQFKEYFDISINNLLASMEMPPAHIDIEAIDFKTTSVLLKGKYYRASFGKFILSGDKEILQILYSGGIGSRRSQGFGMFDVEE